MIVKTFKLWLEATFKQSKEILDDLKKKYNELMDTGDYQEAYELFSSIIQKVNSGEHGPKGFWTTHLSEILEDQIPTGQEISSHFFVQFLSGFQRQFADFLRFAKEGKSDTGEPEYILKLANELGLIEIKEELKLKNLLKKIKDYPETAYNLAKLFNERFPELEDLISTDANWATTHAIANLKGRWADIGKPEVEDVIGTDPEAAYMYAYLVLHKRWADIGKPKVEDVIRRSPRWNQYKELFKFKE